MAPMRLRAVLAAVFACVLSVTVLAQGIPGTRASVAGRRGWDAIRDGRNQDAADAFAEALGTEPRDPSLHLGAGLSAYLMGRSGEARAAL